jgi:hypothetical protein
MKIIIKYKDREMVEQQLRGKSISWTQMEEYLEAHKGKIVTHLENFKDRMIDKSELESKLP